MKYPKYKYFLALLDFSVLILSFLVSNIVWGVIYKGYSFGDIHINSNSFILYLFTALFGVFIFQFNNLYKINVFLSRSKQMSLLVKVLLYLLTLLILISFFLKFSFLQGSRAYFLIVAVISMILIPFARICLFRELFVRFSKAKIIRRNVIIVGSGRAAKSIAAKLTLENSYGIKILGFVDDIVSSDGGVIAENFVLGKIYQLPFICEKYKAHEVIIAIDHITYENLLEIIDISKKLNVSVKLSSELFDVVTEKVVTEKYSGISLINVAPKINPKANLILKRISDFILAFIGVMVLFPVFILISIAIKISSPGPVFYTSDRIGKNGKIFKFLKFRSMTAIEDDRDVEREQQMIEFIKGNKTNSKGKTKIVNESRVTKVGEFLRKTSLDELPQLLNVLQGQMSLVGPRPCLPYEYENFDEWQKRRQEVLPGCTGVWQVAGRGNVSFNDSVILDLYYINNMAPWLDLQIILKTIPVMIFAKGR